MSSFDQINSFCHRTLRHGPRPGCTCSCRTCERQATHFMSLPTTQNRSTPRDIFDKAQSQRFLRWFTSSYWSLIVGMHTSRGEIIAPVVSPISHLGLSIEQGTWRRRKWHLVRSVLVVKSLRAKSFPKWSAGIIALSILGLWKGPLVVSLGNVDFGSDLPGSFFFGQRGQLFNSDQVNQKKSYNQN